MKHTTPKQERSPMRIISRSNALYLQDKARHEQPPHKQFIMYQWGGESISDIDLATQTQRKKSRLVTLREPGSMNIIEGAMEKRKNRGLTRVWRVCVCVCQSQATPGR